MQNDKRTLRLLTSASAEDILALQRVLESATRYWLNVRGQLPENSAADDTFRALPNGKNYSEKYVFGIFTHEKMVGCIDVIRGFPEPSTAMLGLLLLDEAYQNRGLGKTAYLALETYLRTWPEIDAVRIGVVLTNSGVLPFWKSLGFEEAGPRRAYESGLVESETIVLCKRLMR